MAETVPQDCADSSVSLAVTQPGSHSAYSMISLVVISVPFYNIFSAVNYKCGHKEIVMINPRLFIDNRILDI